MRLSAMIKSFLLTLLLLVCGTYAQPNVLSPTAPTTCGPYSGITVTNLDFKYHRFNRSLDYVFVAVPTIPNLNPVLRIDVSILSRKAPGQVILLCDEGIIPSCPLTVSSPVTISGTRILNESYAQDLPSSVWTAPDIDGRATFLLFANPSQIVSCVRTTISNGLSTKVAPLPIATGIIAVLLAIAAGVAGVVTHSAQADRTVDPAAKTAAPQASHTAGPEATISPTHSFVTHMDPLTLFFHFQFISSSGLLSLNYPPVYGQFTSNFAWANFLIPLPAFRRSAQQMRKCTVINPTVQAISAPASTLPFNIPSVNSTLTAQSLIPGIPSYAAKLGINQQDIFGVVYLVFLSVCAIALAVVLVVGILLQVVALQSRDAARYRMWVRRRIRWQQIASNNILRVLSLAFGTLFTFAFFQYTQKCTSGVTLFASIMTLFLILSLLCYVSFVIIRKATQPGGKERLYHKKSPYVRRWGSMYDTLHHDRLLWLGPSIVLVLVRSAIIGFGQRLGTFQVIALLVVEGTTGFILFMYEPYYSKGYNRVSYWLQVTRVISHAMLLPFLDRFRLTALTKNILGIVPLVFNSFIALALAILTILKLGWGIVWFRKTHTAFKRTGALRRSKAIEKGTFQAPDADAASGEPKTPNPEIFTPGLDAVPPSNGAGGMDAVDNYRLARMLRPPEQGVPGVAVTHDGLQQTTTAEPLGPMPSFHPAFEEHGPMPGAALGPVQEYPVAVGEQQPLGAPYDVGQGEGHPGGERGLPVFNTVMEQVRTRTYPRRGDGAV